MRSLSHLLSDHKYLPAWMKGGRGEWRKGRGGGREVGGEGRNGRREGFPRQLLLAPPKSPPTRVEPLNLGILS